MQIYSGSLISRSPSWNYKFKALAFLLRGYQEYRKDEIEENMEDELNFKQEMERQ